MKNLIFLVVLFFSISFYGQTDSTSGKEIEGKVIVQKYGPTINGQVVKKPLKIRKEQLKDIVIGFKSKTKADVKVIGFSIKIPGVQSAIIKGNKIDDTTYQNILKIASKGDMITIFDIKSDLKPEKESEQIVDKIPPILLEIY